MKYRFTGGQDHPYPYITYQKKSDGTRLDATFYAQVENTAGNNWPVGGVEGKGVLLTRNEVALIRADSANLKGIIENYLADTIIELEKQIGVYAPDSETTDITEPQDEVSIQNLVDEKKKTAGIIDAADLQK